LKRIKGNYDEVKKLDSDDEGTEMMINADYTDATNSAPSSINETTSIRRMDSNQKNKSLGRHSRRLTNNQPISIVYD
jgi:hypothetical protein